MRFITTKAMVNVGFDPKALSAPPSNKETKNMLKCSNLKSHHRLQLAPKNALVFSQSGGVSGYAGTGNAPLIPMRFTFIAFTQMLPDWICRQVISSKVAYLWNADRKGNPALKGSEFWRIKYQLGLSARMTTSLVTGSAENQQQS